MLQLSVVRLVLSVVLRVLSHLRTIMWLALAITVLGYGYLVFTNGLDFFAGFHQFKTYALELWSRLQGAYAGVRGQADSFL